MCNATSTTRSKVKESTFDKGLTYDPINSQITDLTNKLGRTLLAKYQMTMTLILLEDVLLVN